MKQTAASLTVAIGWLDDVAFARLMSCWAWASASSDVGKASQSSVEFDQQM
jgi:hypothetical protein